MKYIKTPTEQSTAVSDILLALVAFGGILILGPNITNSGDLWKIIIWSAAFGLIGLAAALGAVAHGLVISRSHLAVAEHVAGAGRFSFCSRGGL
jgi:hypothetical protein